MDTLATPPVARPTPLAPVNEAFARLVRVMDELRENCPWDRKQTFETLRSLTLEEAHELADAITAGDWQNLRTEVGDVLLHIVFYARLAREQELWDLPEMIHGLCDKLIHRHPHIYGDVQVDGAEQVIQNWEAIKLKEKGPEKKRVLGGVPASLPSLIKAYRMQEKAAAVGFDWPNVSGVLDKITEELAEFEAARTESPTPNKAEMEAEFGDLLFSLVNYARHVGINPDDALARTNAKFLTRFTHVENQAETTGRTVKDLTLEEMEAYWQEAKSKP